MCGPYKHRICGRNTWKNGTELLETNYPISFHRGRDTWMVLFCWQSDSRNVDSYRPLTCYWRCHTGRYFLLNLFYSHFEHCCTNNEWMKWTIEFLYGLCSTAHNGTFQLLYLYPNTNVNVSILRCIDVLIFQLSCRITRLTYCNFIFRILY